MKFYEKIKFVRSLKGWTQEDMAAKLNISTQAYAKIERGKTDVHYSRLEQIAEVMEIDLPELLGLDEKNVLNFKNDHSTNNAQYQKIDWQVNSSSTEQTECQHELEKAHLEIELLKQQISDLREINELLKKER